MADLKNSEAKGIDEARTMAELFDALAKASPDAEIFFEEKDGVWDPITYKKLSKSVRHCGLAARFHGAKNGDVACVLSATSPAWMIADMGLQSVGLCVAGIYPTESVSKVAYILRDSGAKFVFVDEAHQLEKVLKVWDDCPSVEMVVCFDDSIVQEYKNDRVMSFANWLALGAEVDQTNLAAWKECLASVRSEDLAILIYTSGTTGPPKGAMITHKNLVFYTRQNSPYFLLQNGWRRPAFLPLCHVAERICTYCALFNVAQSYFIKDPGELGAKVVDIQPHFFLGVPRVFEKFYEESLRWLQRSSLEDRKTYADALALGYQIADALLEGRTPPQGKISKQQMHLEGSIGDMRRAIGLGDVQALSSGGARFDPSLLRWFLAIGIPMLEIYGMTECGLISTNTLQRIRPGSVGEVCPFGEVKLSDKNEILLRGDHVFSGYLNKPEQTREALQNGWFHTGDVGRFDASGSLFIVDRIKDIIITSGGKNITPSEIERRLKAYPIISEAVAIGDGRKFISALILVDRSTVEALVSEEQGKNMPFPQLCENDQVIAAVEAAIQTANSELSRVEQVKAYRIIPKELTPDDDEVTPTMKIKRRVIADKWARLIDEIYGVN